MESIAAVGARIEIQARVAQLAQPGPTPSPNSRSSFSGVLAAALEPQPAGPVPRTMAAVAPRASSRALGETQIDGWIEHAIAATGVPADWAPALRTIARHESGFNPLATNGNDPVGNGRTQRVVGLMQVLPSTFQAHAAPGRGDIYNPVDNLISAIGYIRSRYGSVDNIPGIKALARGAAYRGY